MQLTLKGGVGLVRNAEDLAVRREFSFRTSTGEGWGIARCGDGFVVTDRSDFMHFWDDDFEEVRRLAVHLDGVPLFHLADLECTPKGIVALVWRRWFVVLIHPTTGEVIKHFDFSPLERPPGALSGIVATDVEDEFWLTGTHMDVIYHLKIPYFQT